MYTNANFNYTCAKEVSYKSLTRPSQIILCCATACKIFGILMFAEIWRQPKLLAQSNKYKSPEGFQVAFEKCEKNNFS